jgi:hypothetical protein
MKNRTSRLEGKIDGIQSDIRDVDMEIAAHLTGSVKKLVDAESERGKAAEVETAMATIAAVYAAAPEHAQSAILRRLNGYAEKIAHESESYGQMKFTGAAVYRPVAAPAKPDFSWFLRGESQS